LVRRHVEAARALAALVLAFPGALGSVAHEELVDLALSIVVARELEPVGQAIGAELEPRASLRSVAPVVELEGLVEGAVRVMHDLDPAGDATAEDDVVLERLLGLRRRCWGRWPRGRLG
jgi:hypothetical protein